MPIGWFAVLAFAASFGFYLLLAGTLTGTEAVAAAAVAGATAGFTTIQRLRQDRPLALAMPPARVLIRTMLSLVTDTARVGAVLLAGGGRQGTASWQAFRPGGSSPRDAGRRAIVTLLTSLAPNGFVLDIRPSALKEADRGLLLHRLAPGHSLSDADWPA